MSRHAVMSNSALPLPLPLSLPSASFVGSSTLATRAERSQRRRLFELFESGVLTDVELLVQGEKFAAHRVVLATASPFFYALFTSGMKESREREIALHDLNVAALRELLVYMYLGELCITGDTILAILHTANQLEMLEVVEICCQQLMIELTVANCVDIYVCCANLKTRPPCRLLAHAALAMVETFLGDVMETEAFLNLPLSLVARILLRQRQTQGCEAALQAWVAYDPIRREEQLRAVHELCLSQQPHGNGMPRPSSIMTVDALNKSETRFCWNQAPMAPLKSPVIFAIGGFNGPNALRAVECLDFHTNEWFSVANMHDRRSYSGVAVTEGDKILVMGGAFNSRHLKTVEQYNPETNLWCIMPSMRKARSYLGAAMLDGQVYAIGGFNGMSHLASVERFDVRTQCWEEVAPLNIGRSGLAVTVLNGHIYAIGGYDGRRHLKSIEMYDPRRNQWSILGHAMRHARNGPAAVALPKENCILVFGGESKHGFRMNTSERLDLSTGEWEDVDPFIDSRSGHAAVTMLRDSFVFAFGGSNKKDEYLDDVHRFDPLTKQWIQHSRMVHQRCGLNVAVVQVSRQAPCLQNVKKRSATLGPESRDADSSPVGVDDSHLASINFRHTMFSSLASGPRAPFS